MSYSQAEEFSTDCEHAAQWHTEKCDGVAHWTLCENPGMYEQPQKMKSCTSECPVFKSRARSPDVRPPTHLTHYPSQRGKFRKLDAGKPLPPLLIHQNLFNLNSTKNVVIGLDVRNKYRTTFMLTGRHGNVYIPLKDWLSLTNMREDIERFLIRVEKNPKSYNLGSTTVELCVIFAEPAVRIVSGRSSIAFKEMSFTTLMELSGCINATLKTLRLEYNKIVVRHSVFVKAFVAAYERNMYTCVTHETVSECLRTICTETDRSDEEMKMYAIPFIISDIKNKLSS